MQTKKKWLATIEITFLFITPCTSHAPNFFSVITSITESQEFGIFSSLEES
jgi:hypothetical protein